MKKNNFAFVLHRLNSLAWNDSSLNYFFSAWNGRTTRRRVLLKTPNVVSLQSTVQNKSGAILFSKSKWQRGRSLTTYTHIRLSLRHCEHIPKGKKKNNKKSIKGHCLSITWSDLPNNSRGLVSCFVFQMTYLLIFSCITWIIPTFLP